MIKERKLIAEKMVTLKKERDDVKRDKEYYEGALVQIKKTLYQEFEDPVEEKEEKGEQDEPEDPTEQDKDQDDVKEQAGDGEANNNLEVNAEIEK